MTDTRITTLENALKALGINPDDDPMHHAKRWIEGRDGDRRERDQALTERDDATARVSARELHIKTLEGERDAALKQAEENKRRGEQYRQALNHFFIKMGLNQNADLDQHMAHVVKVCESFDTLAQIRLIFGQPADVVGVIKSVCAELNNANGRAVRAEQTLSVVASMMRTTVPDLLLPWKGNDDVARAIMILHKRIEQAEAVLPTLSKALDAAGAPKNYGFEDNGERPIAAAERIRLLGERIHALREEIRKASDITTHVNTLMEAHNALDALGAPRLADGCALTLTARIWALPR